MHHEWRPLENVTSTLVISCKFSRRPNLVKYRRVLCSDISALHQLYFDVVHKILIPMKEYRSEASYLDLALMELLDSKIPINLASLNIKHI